MSRDAAIKAIRAGYDLHHGTSEDPDRALLDGDRLYAEGLATLAAEGDMEAVHTMAGVIAASAAALGAGDEAAAEAAWEQGIRSLQDGGEAD